MKDRDSYKPGSFLAETVVFTIVYMLAYKNIEYDARRYADSRSDDYLPPLKKEEGKEY